MELKFGGSFGECLQEGFDEEVYRLWVETVDKGQDGQYRRGKEEGKGDRVEGRIGAELLAAAVAGKGPGIDIDIAVVGLFEVGGALFYAAVLDAFLVHVGVGLDGKGTPDKAG